MITNILEIYQFSTIGGVERVLINRALAFKKYQEKYKISIFFYKDYGAKERIQNIIKKYNLNNYLELVDKIIPEKYDYIVSIDTPKVLEIKNIDKSKLTLEFHTFENDKVNYLDDNIYKVRKVIVPSLTAYDYIKSHYDISKINIQIIRNFVLNYLDNNDYITLPNWNKNIVFYLGRVDENKNVSNILEALNIYKQNYNSNILLLIIGKVNNAEKIKKQIENLNLKENIVIIPKVSFEKTDILLNSLKRKKAIFISASLGETFSLSAAEALNHNIPVILSDIPAHQKLVSQNYNYLYYKNDAKSLSEKINNTIINYDKLSKTTSEFKTNFNEKEFIKEWIKAFPHK